MEQQPEVLNNPAADDVTFELGQWLGRRQAFGLVTGKTAAAEVECLRRIRDGNLYRAKGVDWAEFCQKYAGVSSSLCQPAHPAIRGIRSELLRPFQNSANFGRIIPENRGFRRRRRNPLRRREDRHHSGEQRQNRGGRQSAPRANGRRC